MSKASELVLGSLHPHWNSMRFFARGSFSDMSSSAGSKIRHPVPAKFKHVTNIVTCTLLCCDLIT